MEEILRQATPDPDKLYIDGSSLTVADLHHAARNDCSVLVAPTIFALVQQNADTLDEMRTSDRPIYGVNTGFGVLSNRRINSNQSRQLSRNLILSHSVGTGNELPVEVVRAGLVVRANTLSRGHSGVRPVIISTLLEMLNKNLTPRIPSQGSLGSSGDLAPLAHLALVLSADEHDDRKETSGEAWFNGQLMDGQSAMHAAGIERVVLGAKEGLALINGATFSAAILALACYDAAHLLNTAEFSAAMSLESLLGVSQSLDDRIHQARNHPGQIHVAAQLRKYLAGSTLIDSTSRIQDAYSLRCTPQVIGPIRETLDFTRTIVEREINATTDNPLIFEDEALSGGNFHGEPIGLAADYLKIALCELGALSERRIYRLMTSYTNAGLPSMLVADEREAGLKSGLMMLQYTAASLVLENQTLAHPDSIHSLPTSAGQEDHNANATTAARHLRQILINVKQTVAIELLATTQALRIRLQQNQETRLGNGTKMAFDLLAETIPFYQDDFPVSIDLPAVIKLIDQGQFSLLKQEISKTLPT